MKLSKPLSILDIEHRELFFDITDNDKKIAKFEFSDVLYDKDTLQLDFTVSIQVYISISELRSLIDEYKAIVLGHKKVKPRKFNLEYSITLPQAPPIPNFLLNEFYFTFFTDDDNAKKIGLNSKWSTHHDPSTLNTRAVLSGNLEFSVSDFPALAQTLYTSIFDKKSNSKNKINAVLKTAIQLPEKFSKAIFLSSDLFMSVTFAMGGKRILEVECSDVSNKPGTSEYDISLSFKLLGSVSKISSLIQGLKKSLKGDFSSSITLMDVKFGPLKKNAMILCKELPVSFLVNEYKLLRFSSPPTEMLQLQGSENFNSGLKKNQDETETNNRGQHIGSLSSDPIRALARKSNKETQSELVHTTSFFSYLRNAVEKFIQFIKDKLGLGAIDPDWNTHCFHENESPVNVVRLDALHFDITLISCLPKTLPIEMALPNVKLKLFLSDQPLASLTLDHMKVKANPRFEFHSQLRIETNKEQIQSGILSCLDAFSKYLKDKSSFSIFHLFRYSLVIGDSIQVHSKVLEEMIASKMKKSDLTTPTEFRFWTFEGLGSLHFELDSLGLHLDFDVLYSIPLPLSFQFDDFGFFLYHRNDQVLQILLNRPHLTNKVFKSTLSILPHQENIRLVFESFILSPAEFNIGEWFFRALNTESMKQKSFLKIPADILLSQVNEFKRKIPAGNPMPLIHRYPHILFPTFALARARILFFKSTKLSIRIPYFEIRFKSLDEKCLVIRLNESGINFPARNEHAIISIVAPSAFVLKELSNIAKSFKPVFLAFGNSETNAFRLIDRSTFTTDILFKLILGMMHTQEEALPTEGTIPVEAMPTETKPTNAGLKAAEVPPEEVAVQPESENGEKEDEEFLKIEFDDDEEGEDWASSEPTQSLSEAINEVKWPELSDEVKNSEAIINITDTCIV
ncbi:hypothetical protein HMI56_007347 [Coelomomyces lativittatus]|nr:hypothetical protein HMI56_007347 [Coelomomyces lativittatus]